MRTPRSFLLLFLVMALISLGACRKQASNQPTANSNDAAVHGDTNLETMLFGFYRVSY